MRLGRIILAGLAPLVNLSALVPGLAPGIIPFKPAHHSAVAISACILVIPLLTSPSEGAFVSSSLDHRAPHAILTLGALSATPFRSSLWLVTSLVAVNLILRRHQRKLLRC